MSVLSFSSFLFLTRKTLILMILFRTLKMFKLEFLDQYFLTIRHSVLGSK